MKISAKKTQDESAYNAEKAEQLVKTRAKARAAILGRASYEQSLDTIFKVVIVADGKLALYGNKSSLKKQQAHLGYSERHAFTLYEAGLVVGRVL